jgi:enolase
MDKIDFLTARKILNSRGEWTIKAEVFLENGMGAEAAVPEGKSKGKNEAVSVSAERAVENIENKLSPLLKGKNPENQGEIDNQLIETDGTSDKSNLGANTLLAVSLAVARVGALVQNVPLWEYLSKLNNSSPNFPILLANVINGGVHAGNNLDFQEYLLISEETNPQKSIENITTLYFYLKDFLKKEYGSNSISLGDEGGFSPDIEDNIKPFEILKNIINTAGFEGKIKLGLDAAADNIKKEKEELFEMYKEIVSEYPFTYLEDPFSEEDFESFSKLNKEIGSSVLVCGDDLTVTNVSLMEKAEKYKSVNSVIIKPNQIGTLSETFKAINFAKRNNWKVIISHRSGETNDSFITDLAYGTGAFGFKLGAPARGERIAKYNRLLEIEKELK